MHLGKLFLRSVHMHAHRPALAKGEEAARTYEDLSTRVHALAGPLRQRLAPGERVCLAMQNCVEYVEAMWACWLARLCVVPVNSKLHSREIRYVLEDSGAGVCLSQGACLAELREAAGDLDVEFIDVLGSAWQALASSTPGSAARDADEHVHEAGELAWIFYTSGTTGKPKGVMLTHENLCAMALNFHADMQSIDAEDVLIHVAPLSHGSGLYGIAYLMRGGLQVVAASGGFDELELARLLQTYRNASLFAAPTIVNRMTRRVREDGLAVPGLRCFLVGGAPFYAQDIRQAVATFGPKIAQMYGQGETPMTISAIRAEPLARAVAENDVEVLSSVGFAQTSIDIRIQDAQGRTLPAGEPGEIVVAGPTVMKGYWNNPSATAQTIGPDGLRTGDVGFLDDRGLLHLKDRSKDVIISGGSNIYPREVEDALLAHPAVQEVAVIGKPHADWGEVVVAVVVCQSRVTEQELEACCLRQIARFKRPKHYLFVDALPKNPTGKVLKSALRVMASLA